MPVVLVDSSVLLDIFTEDPAWYDWSSRALSESFSLGYLAINPIIYAEISIRFERIEALEQTLGSDFQRLDLPWEAAFLAGKAFLRYKKGGGSRRSPLPDFYIGAHAATAGYTLLTRDARRYQTYFPKLRIVAP